MIRLEEITKPDISILTEMAISAFEEDKIKYGEYPPVIDVENRTLRFIEDGFAFKFVKEKDIIGAAVVFKTAGGSYRLGCLFLSPEYQNQGCGQKILKLLEEEFPDAHKWELDTPHLSFRNHHFYEKAGYTKTGEYYPDSNNKKLILFQYEKIIE
ncbi:MAG TPA: GNAT family N-acetyltransferase [Spirochaetota bacterium]|nr:GNAT family N-acetyltransferase [Spirochaetota bacterium]HQO22821.1 GNAT family N-acetyltransferase [Spirochaetota bacterium]HQQ22208.1 GNAT family N-acetyltransferase [Spirochaetota bacterium]